MASVNKVIIIGNVGKDPEVRYNPSGGAWVTLSLATTRNWKNRETGERQEETEWHRVVFNDRLAEIAGEYLKKGRPVYVEGRLKTRKWQDKEGRDTYTTEIIADQMQLLGGREGGGGQPQHGADQGQGTGGFHRGRPCSAESSAMLAVRAAPPPGCGRASLFVSRFPQCGYRAKSPRNGDFVQSVVPSTQYTDDYSKPSMSSRSMRRDDAVCLPLLAMQ